MKTIATLLAVAAFALTANTADAKGCLKGAAVGGIETVPACSLERRNAPVRFKAETGGGCRCAPVWPVLISRHSRFGRFNSRLRRKNSRFQRNGNLPISL